jgi:hypothetical protein
VAEVINIQTTSPARSFGMPISGHQCALGTTDRETAIVRDRAFTGAVKGLPVYGAVLDAFWGPDAWSPPI